MGIVEQAKDLLEKGLEKGKDFAENHADQVKAGLEKVESLADKATRGKISDKIIAAGDKVEGVVTKGDDSKDE